MSSLSRKRSDGNTKRKRAKQVASLIQSQRGDIHKFFKSNTGASINPNDELAIVAVEEEAGQVALISKRKILTPTLAIAL
jgi:hypothetical protein